MLSGMLEAVIFKEDTLITIKDCINNAIAGTIEPKELKQYILSSLQSILKEVLELFPFYYEQMTTQQPPSAENEQTLAELQEKDQLLEEVAERMQNIFIKLDSKED